MAEPKNTGWRAEMPEIQHDGSWGNHPSTYSCRPNDVQAIVTRANAELDAKDAELNAERERRKLAHQLHSGAVERERLALAELDAKDAEIARLRAWVDCEQDGVCAVAPGCTRHWEERNRELAAEVLSLRARVKELTEWRPMSEAPCGQRLFVQTFYRPRGVLMLERYDDTNWSGDWKTDELAGWLPLPPATEP